MKRFLVIPLMLAYMLAYSGVLVDFHYCMGKLQGTEIGWSIKEKCNTCGMSAKKKGCCHDDAKWYKINDNHKASVSHFNFITAFDAIIPTKNNLANVYIVAQNLIVPKLNSPPLRQVSKNIFYCVFRC